MDWPGDGFYVALYYVPRRGGECAVTRGGRSDPGCISPVLCPGLAVSGLDLDFLHGLFDFLGDLLSMHGTLGSI